MVDKHSHSDFQNGRYHAVDRKHRILGERRSRSSTSRKDYEVLSLNPEREKFQENYRVLLQAIPIEKLKGHQLESRKICGNCHKDLNNPFDGHYHSVSEPGVFHKPVCCACLPLLGKNICLSPIPTKDIIAKVSSMVEKLPYHYWICKECDHKWRNKNPKPRACSECESEEVKKVKAPK